MVLWQITRSVLANLSGATGKPRMKRKRLYRYGHSLSRLFNMDETPMRFELPSSRTLEFSGSRTVPVKSCGAEKRSFTVTLAVAADGKKLPPSVIFKGVRTPRDLAVPDTVRVSFHKKGWMDEKGRNLSHFYFIAHW